MIPGSALLEQMHRYRRWTYAPLVNRLRDCRYPTPIPGVRTKPPPPTQTDCVCYAEGVIVGAAARAGLSFPWSIELHREMMISSPGGDLFGPVTSVVKAGLGVEFERGSPPVPWMICQGWGHGWRGGHAFLVRDVDGALDGPVVVVAECSLSAGGVRERRVPWAEVMRAFPHLRAARLLVDAGA